MNRTALRALCIIGLAVGGAGACGTPDPDARPLAPAPAATARSFAGVAATPPLALSTGILPVMLGKTRVVATTNTLGASIVWVVNGAVIASRTATGLKDTLAFVNAACPDTSVLQIALRAGNTGTATTRVLPCTPRPVATVPAPMPDADAAFRDTFPDANRAIWPYAYQFAGADGVYLDSVLVQQPTIGRGTAAFIQVGRRVIACPVAKNRYTGAVIVRQPADATRCEGVRQAWAIRLRAGG